MAIHVVNENDVEHGQERPRLYQMAACLAGRKRDRR